MQLCHRQVLLKSLRVGQYVLRIRRHLCPRIRCYCIRPIITGVAGLHDLGLLTYSLHVGFTTEMAIVVLVGLELVIAVHTAGKTTRLELVLVSA